VLVINDDGICLTAIVLDMPVQPRAVSLRAIGISVDTETASKLRTNRLRAAGHAVAPLLDGRLIVSHADTCLPHCVNEQCAQRQVWARYSVCSGRAQLALLPAYLHVNSNGPENRPRGGQAFLNVGVSSGVDDLANDSELFLVWHELESVKAFASVSGSRCPQ
jgi:hypothetical protein